MFRGDLIKLVLTFFNPCQNVNHKLMACFLRYRSDILNILINIQSQ